MYISNVMVTQGFLISEAHVTLRNLRQLKTVQQYSYTTYWIVCPSYFLKYQIGVTKIRRHTTLGI